MHRLLVVLTSFWLLASPALATSTSVPNELEDLYFGEALFYALQDEWFAAITRLDTELEQHHRLDQPQLDTLYPHIGLADFAVGDFELAYRMHQRAGRAISAVIDGDVSAEVRNDALYRLARIYLQKAQPVNALHALERISGAVPDSLRADLAFLRTQVLMATGQDAEAIPILQELEQVESLAGFAGYNLGIALLRTGEEQQGRQQLDRNGQLDSDSLLTLALRDKANLVLGDKLLGDEDFNAAKTVLDRVRLEGPLSNRALLGSGWADASAKRFQQALVPWSLLAEREVTDLAVQEALLALPYAYGKLGVYSKAALLYGQALQAFSGEIDKLGSSIKSIREGHFLQALRRPELQQDANWVVRLRRLPETPETYYLLDLMASHDFQEMLKNYLDLDQLSRQLNRWSGDLDAFEELIERRRAYYQPLLPQIDEKFRLLDSQMRLRLEQREGIEQRLQALLMAPRPADLTTPEERIYRERLTLLEQALETGATELIVGSSKRIQRLKGVLIWTIQTEYDQRLTDAHQHLKDLQLDVEQLQQQYHSFVRIRQAATQSYQGYEDSIGRQRGRIAAARAKVRTLLARQGHLLEEMAVDELSRRRARLEEFQVKARFAMADSFDRAARTPERQEETP